MEKHEIFGSKAQKVQSCVCDIIQTLVDEGFVPDIVYSLFYDADHNWFVDEDGEIVYNMYQYITPNDLYLFKRSKCYMVFPFVQEKGVSIELYYPNGEVGFYSPNGDCV